MTRLPSPSPAEAQAALKQLAGRRTLPIHPDLLVQHIRALPGSWDWPVQRAAFEALLRRLGSARKQELTVLSQPAKSPWGRYRLGRPDTDGALPYVVSLESLEPLSGSCGCADFLRSSLGLCKHLLAVIDHLAAKPTRWRAALKARPVRRTRPQLAWEASSGHGGALDPLGGLRLELPTSVGRPSGALRRLFDFNQKDAAGRHPLVALQANDLAQRQRIVTALQRALRAPGLGSDAAAPSVLRDEAARLERLLRLQAKRPALDRALRSSKRKLYDYQKAGIARFFAEGRLVLADDMGLGKTTQATAAVAALHGAGLVTRGLLVVPAPLKAQWEAEWRAITDTPVRVVDGTADERRGLYRKHRRGFLIANYEQVVRDLPEILRWAPQVVVLDEAQRIKNWATRTALAVKQLQPDHRLVLTGTPMENRLDELASVVEWVDDRALEPKWRLGPFHSVFADGKKEVTGARNLDALRARLAPVLLRRERAEVLAQLPRRQDTVLPVDLTEEQRAAHDELNQDIAKLASITSRRPLKPAEFLRLMALLNTQRIIANGMAQQDFASTWPGISGRTPTPALLASLGSPKLIELRELISNLVLTQNRKVVVFSQWRRMLQLAAWAVSDLLDKHGRRALFFTGQEGARRRQHNLVDFHDDPATAVLFLSDAGGVGLNLQRAASACVNLELPWNPAVLEQRIGRIYRLGQKQPVAIYNLVSRACIEERIAALVSDKRALFRSLFTGKGDEIRFERSGALLSLLPPATEPAQALAGATEVGDDELEGVQDAEASEEETGRKDAAAGAEPMMAPNTPSSVGALLGALTVSRTPEGRVNIEAPPEAADALISLFEGMARLLGARA